MLNISYDTFPVLILVPLLLLSCVYHRPPILNAFDTARVFEHAQEEFITKVRKLHPPPNLNHNPGVQNTTILLRLAK